MSGVIGALSRKAATLATLAKLYDEREALARLSRYKGEELATHSWGEFNRHRFSVFARFFQSGGVVATHNRELWCPTLEAAQALADALNEAHVAALDLAIERAEKEVADAMLKGGKP